MCKRGLSFFLCLLTVFSSAALLFSCRGSIGGEDTVKQAVNLAISVGAFPQTKVDVSSFTEVDPEHPVFRGMTDIRLVPFSKGSAVTSSDKANTFPLGIPGFYTLSPSLSAYYYASGVDAWFPVGTASMLLYGRAPGSGSDSGSKHLYGSLTESGFTGGADPPSASALKFSPEAIVSGTAISDEAKTIAGVLNGILLGNPLQMTAYYGEEQSKLISLNWNENLQESNLREAYRQITNEGAFIPGSGPLVETLLSSLYGMLKTYESHNSNVYEVVVDGFPYEARNGNGDPLLYRDLYNSLRDHILARFTLPAVTDHAVVDADNLSVQFRDEAVRNYPDNLGLPSGCAILRWTPTGFVVPQVNGVEGIAPMNRYCYPPALYYYANTTLRTSQDSDIGKSYTDKGYTTWAQVLSDYTLGSSISSNTRSIALVEPAHFAVGMLTATVKASRSWLQDNDGLPETTVDAVDGNLPLTGIILGGQYVQDFSFTPIYSGSEDDIEYYLYDNQMPEVYLTSDTSAPFRTLSLETPEDKDVYFTLEFRNDTGKTFYGADGRILPGRKFYMVGKLELPAAPRAFDSVMVKDHYTKVSCTINSLEGAYNAVPDLGVPQLVVGVQTQVNWTLSTPTTLIME